MLAATNEELGCGTREAADAGTAYSDMGSANSDTGDATGRS